jgi:uncharacterized damage-inducible protein DinB
VSASIDPFVLEHAPGPLVQLDPALVRARVACAALLDALAAIPDDKLTCQWMWGDNAVDVRYGFYRVFETLESASSAVSRVVAPQPSSEARDAVAAAAASRWALHGVLATLSDADLDADPGGGEWTIRQTMQHIINSQRGYAWSSAYWLSVRDQPRSPGPQRAPADVLSDFPEEDEEALGSLASVRQELDEVVDATSSRFATLTDADLQVMGGWSGFPVTIGFRQWRWSSHIAEHTIQIEKTIDMLGKRRSEVDWLVRLIGRAFGNLGPTVFGRASAGAAGPVLDLVARDLDALRLSLTAAAQAAIPSQEW